MSIQDIPTPEKHDTEAPALGLSFVDHVFIPLNEHGTLPRVEGEYHRKAIKDLAHSALLIARLQHRNEVLEKQLHTDALTGIANRLAFAQELVRRTGEAREEGDFALMFIDLDKFKQANDTLGHEKGDELLVEVANKLQINLREGESLARLGGDEFVAIVNPKNAGNSRRNKNLNPEEVIEGLTNRLSDEVSAAAEQVGAPFVGASIGVAYFRPGETPEELLHRADQEMYRVKQEKGASR